MTLKTSGMLCSLLVKALMQKSSDLADLMLRGETVVSASTDGYSVHAELADGTKIRISAEQEGN